jgi:hypothetical protein
MDKGKLLSDALRVRTPDEALIETMEQLALLCRPQLLDDSLAAARQALDLAHQINAEEKRTLGYLELTLSTITALLAHVQIDLFGQVRVSTQYGELRRYAQQLVDILKQLLPEKPDDQGAEAVARSDAHRLSQGGR